MNEIDKKDLIILRELSVDCRQPSRVIAKMAGLSREVVDYRIKHLVKDGVIREFVLEADLAALGFTKNVVYLELSGVTEKRDEEIRRLLSSHPFVCWLVSSTGKWSFIFDLHSRDAEHLAALLDDIKESLGRSLGDLRLVSLREHCYFHSKIFGGTQVIQQKNIHVASLDEKDRRMLHLMSRNARAGWREIGDEIGLTPEAVSRRASALEKAGVIKKFSIFTDLHKLGFELYNVQISLSNQDEKAGRRVLDFLVAHHSVCYYYRPLAHWDVEFGVFVHDAGELRNMMREMRDYLGGQIRIIDTVLFYEEITSPALPKGVFEPRMEFRS